MENVVEMRIELSKKGYPCLWENGGACSNTGDSQIIAGRNGEKKTALYIRRGGHLACGNHALVVVSTKDWVIKADHHRGDFTIRIYRIVSIDINAASLSAELVCEYSKGEWDSEPPAYLHDAVVAAKNKATSYHCRSPYYVNDPIKN